jgi:hypothetical protein
MKRRPGGYGLWVTALCWSLPLMATADGRLRWQAPRGCPTQQEVERSLARVESAEQLSVDAVVERDAQGYRLRLRVDGVGQRFERELSAESCEVLVESAVFLVELAGSQLTAAAPKAGRAPRVRAGGRGRASGSDAAVRADDRDRVSGADEAAAREAERGRTTGSDAAARGRAGVSDIAAREAARSDVVEPELLSTALPETTHRAPVDSRTAAGGGDVALPQTSSLRLGFGAAVIEAGLNGVAPHFALDLSWALAEWSIGLRVGALLHPVLRVAEAAEVDLQTNAGQLLGCRYWDVARVLIGPCMVVSALRTSAESTGLTGQQSSSATWLAAGPALQLQLRVMRSVLLGIEIGAWAAVTPRPSFEVAGNTVARAGTLAGYARLGAAYELW